MKANKIFEIEYKDYETYVLESLSSNEFSDENSNFNNPEGMNLSTFYPHSKITGRNAGYNDTVIDLYEGKSKYPDEQETSDRDAKSGNQKESYMKLILGEIFGQILQNRRHSDIILPSMKLFLQT